MSERARARGPTRAARRRRANADSGDDDDDEDTSGGAPSARASRSHSTSPTMRTILSPSRRSRPVPDHYYRPSLRAELMAGVRRLCGEGDPYFLSRAPTCLPPQRCCAQLHPPTTSLAGHQVASSTRLQMLMTFNVYVALAFAILHPLMFQWKASPPLPIVIHVGSLSPLTETGGDVVPKDHRCSLLANVLLRLACLGTDPFDGPSQPRYNRCVSACRHNPPCVRRRSATSATSGSAWHGWRPFGSLLSSHKC